MALTERDIETLAKGVAPVLKAAIAAATQPLKDQIASLTERVVETETKSLGPYRGAWAPGFYRRGEATTWGGSLWIAMAATQAKPGEATDESRAWKLAVKKGADGKDAGR